MNSVHDMGGMENYGPVVVEENEPVFHEDWERTIFSLTLALLPAGYCAVDEIRRITESMPPVEYLQSRYYEKWLYSLEHLLVEKDVLTSEEIEKGRSIREKGGNSKPPVSREIIEYAMTQPLRVDLDMDLPAKFNVGDRVLAKNMHPPHHTRIPIYIRGRQGEVVEDHGIFLLPDTNAHGGPDKPQHVYSVRFLARDLWGEEAPAKDSVCIDLFDDYMEPVG